MAIFRIIKGELDLPKYLHLYNYHNGYYGHGFQFKVGEKVIAEGGL